MPRNVTSREILRRLPNASKSFLQRNAEDSAAALPANDPQPTEGGALQRLPKGKKASSRSPNERVGLAFRVYAVRPADADGWAFKEIIDALAGAKILDGDRWDQFYIAGVHSEKVHSKDQERTEILIIYPVQAQIEIEPIAPEDLLPSPAESFSPTESVSRMTRPHLIERFWANCSKTWNRQAFNTFVETLSDADLQQYVQMGGP